MKDAYSFHDSESCLTKTYDVMYETYKKIFERSGLKFRAVIADTGSIGGTQSHEFMVLAESGEDAIAFSDSSDYAANIEKATSIIKSNRDLNTEICKSISKVDTPNIHTMEQLSKFLNVQLEKTIKSLIVKITNDSEEVFFALILRGDHQLNELKTIKELGISGELEFASDEEIKNLVGCDKGSIGPVDIKIKVIVDSAAHEMKNFVCGANQDNKHLVNVNWTDCPIYKVADIRNVLQGELSPDGNGKLLIKRGIEVGHIFQLGTKYSESMNAKILDENGKDKYIHMGCYGIGIGRIVAAAIEQNHDNKGIIWTDSLSPFSIAIVPINMEKSQDVNIAATTLHDELTEMSFDVLLMDQKNKRLGNMLADVELIGIPHRIIIGDRGLKEGNIEYQHRTSDTSQNIKIKDIKEFLMNASGLNDQH
jgi:prolyl-tRNA synthetase